MLAVAAAMVNAAATTPNMNGEYTIANPGLKAFARTSNMSHYAGGGSPVEYFDVYSPPIRSRYGQTFWTMMDAVPLPKEIVERFDGKTMAITGVCSLHAVQLFRLNYLTKPRCCAVRVGPGVRAGPGQARRLRAHHLGVQPPL